MAWTLERIADEIEANANDPYFTERSRVDLPGGFTLKISISYDEYHALHEDGDWFGDLDFSNPKGYYSGYSTRPDNMDGNAEKLRTRDGYVWWQPPADVKRGTEGFDCLRKIVAGYYSEEWTYVIVSGTLERNGIEIASDSIGAVQSDWIRGALLEYVLPELVQDYLPTFNLLEANPELTCLVVN